MVDLLIRNGLVIDGSGSPGFYAAVIVTGDTLTIHRGDDSNLEADRVIDMGPEGGEGGGKVNGTG